MTVGQLHDWWGCKSLYRAIKRSACTRRLHERPNRGVLWDCGRWAASACDEGNAEFWKQSRLLPSHSITGSIEGPCFGSVCQACGSTHSQRLHLRWFGHKYLRLLRVKKENLHLFAFECTVDPKSTWTLKSHLMYELHCTRNKIKKSRGILKQITPEVFVEITVFIYLY